VIKPIWAAVGGVALLGTAGGVGVLIATTGGEEEAAVQNQQTASVAATATASPGPPPTEVTPSPAATPARTASPEPSPKGIPADWQSYTDPALGFSLRYPPDLMATDLTPPSPASPNLHVIEFRSVGDRSRGFAISFSETFGLSLEQWAIEYAACRPDSMQPATLNGIAAIACTREVLEGHSGPAILAQNENLIALISGGGFKDSEFDQVTSSFHFN